MLKYGINPSNHFFIFEFTFTNMLIFTFANFPTIFAP